MTIESVQEREATPPQYAGRVKYTPEAAWRYQTRKQRKHSAEVWLVERAFARVPRGRVLDVPCGGGRMSLLLAGKGYTVTAADLAEPMLEITRKNFRAAKLGAEVVRQDIEALEFADESFDAVLCFRLFHHFPSHLIRARVVAELCRVARGHVVISYFSPYSPTSLKRIIQTQFLGRRADKFATPLREVRRYFAENGFRLVRDYARLQLVHTLHAAVFERVARPVQGGRVAHERSTTPA